MSQYRPGGFRVLPPVVKNLLIINVLMFLATEVLLGKFGVNLRDILGLHWIGSTDFEIYQVISYMFMHGDVTHILFNMFAVWMFGSAIENTWGAKRFLTYYVLTGIGAAFFHYVILYLMEIGPTMAAIDAFLANPSVDSMRAILADHTLQLSSRLPEMYSYWQESEPFVNAVYSGSSSPEALERSVEFFTVYQEYYLNLPNVVGASGSLFGLLLAFGMLFPNARIFLLFFPVPIKAKYFVMLYGAFELYSGLQNNPADNVAHFAHLGGMIFGFILIKLWQNNSGSNSYYQEF